MKINSNNTESELIQLLKHINLNLDKEEIQSGVKHNKAIENVFKKAEADQSIDWLDITFEMNLIHSKEEYSKIDVIHYMKYFFQELFNEYPIHTREEIEDLEIIYLNTIEDYTDNDGWINNSELYIRTKKYFPQANLVHLEYVDNLQELGLVEGRKTSGINQLGFKKYNLDYRKIW